MAQREREMKTKRQGIKKGNARGGRWLSSPDFGSI